MEKHQKIGYDIFDLICNEHLARVELDLIFMQLKIILHFREIKNARERERIIDIEVYPKERIFGKRIKLLVELDVVLILQFDGRFRPQWRRIVDNLVYGDGLEFGFTVFIHTIFYALLLGTKLDFDRKELAVFFQDALQPEFIQKLF